MSRIVFVTWDGGGNVTPAVRIAGELRDRGEEVRFVGQEQQRSAIEAEGFAFSSYRTPGAWRASETKGGSTQLGFLALTLARRVGTDLLANLEQQPADLVVVDCLLLGALEAVERAGLPHAVLVHTTYEALLVFAGGPFGLVARLRGFRVRALWAKASTLLVTSFTGLDRASDSGVAVHHTGPALPAVAGPANDAGERPTVLVSLSTTFVPGQLEALQRILDALADAPVRILVTTGPAIDPAEVASPENAEVHRYVPHGELMPAVSLVVGHGGHATTTLALAHDLPLVVMPMNPAFDQPTIAAAVERLGVGTRLGKKASPAAIRAAVEGLLADGPHREQLRQVGLGLRGRSGVAAAADLVQSTAGVRPVG